MPPRSSRLKPGEVHDLAAAIVAQERVPLEYAVLDLAAAIVAQERVPLEYAVLGQPWLERMWPRPLDAVAAEAAEAAARLYLLSLGGCKREAAAAWNAGLENARRHETRDPWVLFTAMAAFPVPSLAFIGDRVQKAGIRL
jgi:hypothetical protein